MSDEVVRAVTAEAVPTPPIDLAFNVREATDFLREQRQKESEQAKTPRAEDGKFAPRTPAEESVSPSQETDAAAPEGAPPGETEEPDPVEEQPSIEPPRSWTKEEKEAFHNLSPEHQKTFLEREQKRDKDIRSRLNEANEQGKRALADAQAHQQARQKYEQALPQLVQALRATHFDKFSDIKTQADVDRLASEDVLRYVEFDNSRKKLAAAQTQAQAIQQMKTAQQAQQWRNWVVEQDAKFVEKHPEFADKEKAKELFGKAKSLLSDAGFSDDEMSAAKSGNHYLSIFGDARMQSLIYDALRYRTAQADKEKARVQPPPPKVQKPGPPRTAQDTRNVQTQTLEKRLEQTRGRAQLLAGADLLKARRASR